MVNLEVLIVATLPCVVLLALPCVILLLHRRAPVRGVVPYLPALPVLCPTYLFLLSYALHGPVCEVLCGREYDLRHVALSRDLARRSRLSGGVSQWRSATLSSLV